MKLEHNQVLLINRCRLYYLEKSYRKVTTPPPAAAAAGGGVWGILSWHILLPAEDCLNTTVYQDVVAVFMTTVYPFSNGCFQQDICSPLAS